MWYHFSTMSVYIEYVIIDNLAVNSLLLALVFWSLKEKVPRLRTFASAGLGTLFSCLLPLFALPAWLTFPLKILLSVAMVLIVKGKRRFFVYLLLFYLFTFLFGGAVIGAFYLFTGQMIAADSGTLNYSLDVPVGLIVAGIAFVVFVSKKLFAVFYRRRETENFFREVRIERAGNSVGVRGYLDSGNLLSYKGNPVVMVTSRTALKICGITDFRDLSCHNLAIEYIEINTVSGTKRLPVFRVDKLFVGETLYDGVWCGISFEPFKMECDVLLNCVTK